MIKGDPVRRKASAAGMANRLKMIVRDYAMVAFCKEVSSPFLRTSMV